MTATMELMEPINRLDRDLKTAARLLGKKEARYLVDAYYIAQDSRIRADAQVRASEEAGEPNRLLVWNADSFRRFEEDYKRALDAFTDEYTVGRWCKSICGIGPVITAGLLSHLDIGIAKTVGHFWRFAGLDPTMVWGKGQKRPWNAQLKTLVAFKLGECFVKVQGNKKDFYGKLFRERRDRLEQENTDGHFKGNAESVLSAKRFGKDTKAIGFYSQGKLPPAHLHAMARRWTVKLFLAHLHHIMHVDWFGAEPMKPYIFEHGEGDHRHYVGPPNWPWTGEAGKGLKDMRE